MHIYPLKMAPVYKQYIWGGDNLRTLYSKKTPEGGAAESWEISCNAHGVSSVANGAYSGKTLLDVMEIMQGNLHGGALRKDGTFPLLFKLLDAKDNLSVQVHPDDDYGEGNMGKTEMWYVLHAEKGAQLVYGFRSAIDRAAFENAILNSTLTNLLNYVDVHRGDTFFIPSGMVHAVGKGLVIAELQQNSDTTYRVFDYNRRDAQGNTRELHIQKALDVANCESSLGKEKTERVSCPFFTCDVESIAGSREFSRESTMFLLFFADGEGVVTCNAQSEAFKKGDSFVIPAAANGFTIKGDCRVMVMR